MKKAIELAEALLWSALACLVAANADAMIGKSLALVYGDPAAAPAAVLQNLIYLSPVFPLGIGVLAVVRLKLAGQDVGALIGIRRDTLARDALIGVTAGIAAIVIAIVSLRLSSEYVDLPPMHQLPVSVHVYFMTVGAIVPGVCEELYFRGLLMQVGRRLPAPALIALTALAFSLWHVGTIAYLPHTFLMGLIFGGLATLSGRLAAPIIAHTFANAGMGVLFLTGFNGAVQ